jgi:hypothetical protein
MTHRFEFTDIFNIQNPEAYNVCAYKWGSELPNEWLVFGAHFDIAPPANAVILDPHTTGSRTYGTRVGAYDNTAGTSMVLETAKVLADFESRRTMVFCLWSGEEGGKRGSDYWTEYYVKEDHPEVTVTNYINLDMAGVNWPGGGGAPHGDPDPQIDEGGYPKDSEIWPMRVYIGPGPNHDSLDQPGMVGLSQWIGGDALGLEEQMGTLVGVNYTADTWKTDVWLDMDRPEIIVYEDTTARSDHASFQDNLGTVTVGFGGLVDNNLGPVHVQPDISLPGVCRVVHPNQRSHLFLKPECISSYPLRQPYHPGLVETVVVRPRSDVDSHRPYLRVLRVTTLIDLRIRVTVRRPTPPGPVHSCHVEIDVIRDRDLGVVFLHVVLGPVVRTSLATFLTRPQAEHHRSTGLKVS